MKRIKGTLSVKITLKEFHKFRKELSQKAETGSNTTTENEKSKTSLPGTT
jgi:hypothetical protein